SRPQAAFNFYNSPENRGNQVKFFYLYFLKREASPAEVTFYSDYLRSGGDEGRVMQNFILSPEYTGQNTDTQFVTTMYYALLGRGASAGEGRASVTPLGNHDVTRQQAVPNFLRSPEGIDRVVRSDYVAYLKRAPEDAALASFRAQVQGGATFGSVAVSLLGSAEFFANAGNHL